MPGELIGVGPGLANAGNKGVMLRKVEAAMHKSTLQALLLLATLCGARVAAGSAITVLGNTDAQDCFLSASTGSMAGASLDSCRKALASGELAPTDHAATLVNMGILLNGVGRTDQALEAFAEALSMSPNLPEAILSRGNSHFLRRDYERALADYDLSLQHGIRNEAVAHFNRGMAHEKTKDHRSAAKAYDRALEIDPGFRRAQARRERLQKQGLDQMAPPRPKPPVR